MEEETYYDTIKDKIEQLAEQISRTQLISIQELEQRRLIKDGKVKRTSKEST